MAEQTTLNPQRGEVVTSVEPDAVFLEARNAYLLAQDALAKSFEALTASQLVEANAANALSQATTAISLANTAQTTANNALASQVSVTGATMTGPLYVNSVNPSVPYEAAAKGYVDTQVATIATDAINSVAVLKADTTYVNSQDAALQSQLNTGAASITDLYSKLFPVGGIIMWSGPIASIPSGWALCDGTLSTPDLRDRFIIGAGHSFRPPGQVGGAFAFTSSVNGGHSHSLNIENSGAHNHTITVNSHALTTAQIPSHQHETVNIRGGVGDNSATNAGFGTAGRNANMATVNNFAQIPVGLSGAVGSGQGHSHTASSDQQALHSHVGSTSTEAAHTHTVDCVPPYYALAFIMKT